MSGALFVLRQMQLSGRLRECKLTVMRKLSRHIDLATWSIAIAALLSAASLSSLWAQAGDLQALERELALVPLPDPRPTRYPYLKIAAPRISSKPSSALAPRQACSQSSRIPTMKMEHCSLIWRADLALASRSDADTWRGRSERNVGRELRCAGPHSDARNCSRPTSITVPELWGTEADFGFSKTQARIFRQVGTRPRALRRRARRSPWCGRK